MGLDCFNIILVSPCIRPMVLGGSKFKILVLTGASCQLINSIIIIPTDAKVIYINLIICFMAITANCAASKSNVNVKKDNDLNR